MLAVDFLASLKSLRLSLTEFLAITGEKPSKVASWIDGSVPVPCWADALTFAWEEHLQLLETARCETTAVVSVRLLEQTVPAAVASCTLGGGPIVAL